MHGQAEFFANQAGQRSQGYWLLSKLFLERPDGTSLTELDNALADLAEGDSPLLPAIKRLRLAVGDVLDDPQTLLIEMTRHLLAVTKESGNPLPFESHVRENRLPGDATEQMQILLRESGYDEVVPKAGPPDHLGAELRFMALLCHDERDAWLVNDAQAAVNCLHLQRHMLQTHLGRMDTRLLPVAGRTHIERISQGSCRLDGAGHRIGP